MPSDAVPSIAGVPPLLLDDDTAVTDAFDAGGAATGPAPAELYERAFPASRTGPLYNAFSYPTKISPEAIALFIATHTRPGDTVMDVFAGSGTTGIAVKLCDRPTEAMLALASEMGLRPEWGPRTAILYDVGVLGSFVSQVMCNPPDPDRFGAAALELVARARSAETSLYEAVDDRGEPGVIRHVIWSEVLACPQCKAATSYWDAAVRREPLRLQQQFECSECHRVVAIAECDRVTENVADPLLGGEIRRRVRAPVCVYGRTGTRRWQRPATARDGDVAARAADLPLPVAAPVCELEWGDLYRSGYHTGITHLHHFYSPRNFFAIATLWGLIGEFPEDLQDALRFLVLSFNASHSTLMTRVVVKRGNRDFVLTGAQSGVLYVSGLPVEKNVYEGVARKARTIKAAFAIVANSHSDVHVRQASSTSLDVPDGSVSYVFTDPPFGDYIPYAEVNQLNELWLGARTDRRDEIVMSASGGKTVGDYAHLMSQVFREVRRVLRPEGRATVVFHSAKAQVWRALTDAFTGAGLGIRRTSVLARTQSSFKQVVSPTTVKGDVLILLEKSDRSEESAARSTADEVIAAVLADAAERGDDEQARERLFSRFITRCLVEGVPVSIDAADFYARLSRMGTGA